MRTSIKVGIAMVCTGVLLMGIGTGVAVNEGLSLQYAEEQEIEWTEKIKTQEFDLDLAPGKTVIVDEDFYQGRVEIVTDETLPENIVRWEVSYNGEIIEPYLKKMSFAQYLKRYYDWDEDDREYRKAVSEYSSAIFVSVRQREVHAGAGRYFALRDQILEDLKNGTIRSYTIPEINSVTVKVNPNIRGQVISKSELDVFLW